MNEKYDYVINLKHVPYYKNKNTVLLEASLK